MRKCAVGVAVLAMALLAGCDTQSQDQRAQAFYSECYTAEKKPYTEGYSFPITQTDLDVGFYPLCVEILSEDGVRSGNRRITEYTIRVTTPEWDVIFRDEEVRYSHSDYDHTCRFSLEEGEGKKSMKTTMTCTRGEL